MAVQYTMQVLVEQDGKLLRSFTGVQHNHKAVRDYLQANPGSVASYCVVVRAFGEAERQVCECVDEDAALLVLRALDLSMDMDTLALAASRVWHKKFRGLFNGG